jgi:hypothetical protein
MERRTEGEDKNRIKTRGREKQDKHEEEEEVDENVKEEKEKNNNKKKKAATCTTECSNPLTLSTLNLVT